VANWLTLGFQLRRDSEVRPKFEEWCRQHSDHPEVYALKAQLRGRDGDFRAAAVEDRLGLKVAPYNRKLRIQLASHLDELRNWPETHAAAQAALEVAPGDFRMQMISARCLGHLGRAPEATALLDRLLKDYPGRRKEIEDLRRTLPGKG
jgi:tetratricopeptide (TPR) repeat protein